MGVDIALCCIALFQVLGYIFILSCLSTPSTMQVRMSKLLVHVATSTAIVATCWTIYVAIALQTLARASTLLPACLLVVCMSRCSQLRPKIQARISSLYDSHSTVAACAGIAALMSDCSLQKALTQAIE